MVLLLKITSTHFLAVASAGSHSASSRVKQEPWDLFQGILTFELCDLLQSDPSCQRELSGRVRAKTFLNLVWPFSMTGQLSSGGEDEHEEGIFKINEKLFLNVFSLIFNLRETTPLNCTNEFSINENEHKIARYEHEGEKENFNKTSGWKLTRHSCSTLQHSIVNIINPDANEVPSNINIPMLLFMLEISRRRWKTGITWWKYGCWTCFRL